MNVFLGSGERQENFVAFYANRVGPDGAVCRCARLEIELPGVERADDLPVPEDAVRQRAASMRAGVLGGEELPVTLTEYGDSAAVYDVGAALAERDRVDRAKRDNNLQCGVLTFHTSPLQLYQYGSAELGRVYGFIRFGPGIGAGCDRPLDLGIQSCTDPFHILDKQFAQPFNPDALHKPM